MRLFVILLLMYVVIDSRGQQTDTLAGLEKINAGIKQASDMTYSYEMEVKFPNGQHDRLKGTVYMNRDELLYYNECDAFTMIYSDRWFYKADHRKMKIIVVDMNKEYSKKQKKANENDIFQNGLVTAFLDTALLKTSRVRFFNQNKDTLRVALEFPANSVVRKIDISYDEANEALVAYSMTVCNPWQDTKKVSVIETNIRCRDFKKNVSPDNYRENNFFSYKNSKIELKKYKGYKFSTKI